VSLANILRYLLAAAAAAAVVATPAQNLNDPPVEATDPDLSLSQVVEYALRRYPESQTLGPATAEADALGDRAGSWVAGQPALALQHETDRPGTGVGYRAWQGGIELPLWRPGERSAARALATRSGAYAQAHSQALRLQVTGEVRDTLWALAIADNQTRLAREQLEVARNLEHQISRRLEQGDVPRTDLMIAREETLQRETAVEQSRLAVAQSLAAYEELTGLTRVPAQIREQPADVDLTNNPALAEAQIAVTRALTSRALVRESGGGSPSLSVGMRSENDGRGQQIDSVGVGISLPLSLRAHRAPQEAAAALEVSRAQAERDRRLRQLTIDLRQARQAIDTAHAALALARDRAALSAQSLTLARKAYALGESPLLDLLRVQSRAFDAARESTLRELELYRATAHFNQTLGVLP